ncbi:hypothetical protein [Micromonospora sp. R77]|nr:hypothetical protein [Micromonospora sp. R77]
MQDEVLPSVDQGEAVGLFTVDRSTSARWGHGYSIGSMSTSDKG